MFCNLYFQSLHVLNLRLKENVKFVHLKKVVTGKILIILRNTIILIVRTSFISLKGYLIYLYFNYSGYIVGFK